jgi:hypothetical protein
MILTGENIITRRKPCPSVTLSTENLTCAGLELNPDLCSEKMVTDRLSHDTAALFRRILDAAIRMKDNPNGPIELHPVTRLCSEAEDRCELHAVTRMCSEAEGRCELHAVTWMCSEAEDRCELHAVPGMCSEAEGGHFDESLL